MFYRLKSEITYKGYTMKEFSELCNIPYQKWLRKMKNNTFTLDEAFMIKKLLGSDLLIEDLFLWEDR